MLYIVKWYFSVIPIRDKMFIIKLNDYTEMILLSHAGKCSMWLIDPCASSLKLSIM